jgi:hypothetical protein
MKCEEYHQADNIIDNTDYVDVIRYTTYFMAMHLQNVMSQDKFSLLKLPKLHTV